MSILDNNVGLLVSRLAVMKPAVVKEDHVKGLLKLEALYTDPDYVIEDKVDGCHYLMVGCRFFSTENVEKTDNYPHLRDFFVKLSMANIILDGEINYPGKTSQYCTRVTGADPSTAVAFQQKNGLIHYTIWDIVRTPKGTWLHDSPLKARRKVLEYWYENYVKGTPMEEYIHLTRQEYDNKLAFKQEIIDNGGEGAVLKHINSMYIFGKKPAWQWVKVKIRDTGDLFITGYDAPKIAYDGGNFEGWPYWREVKGETIPVSKYYYFDWIGSLILSGYVNGKSTIICRCSGLTEELRKDISDNKEAYLDKVVKISYMEKTEAGIPRHPRFEEFHESKIPEECEWELT